MQGAGTMRVACLAAAMALTGCSFQDDAASASEATVPVAEPPSEEAPSEEGDDGTSTVTGSGQPQGGTLTAGAWDDNRNFDRFMEFKNSLAGLPGILPFSRAEHEAAHEIFKGNRQANQTLDIALVIDTTGSMGDEITYLQAEFSAISEALEDKHPNSEQRWSLIVYRDVDDEYEVRSFDFLPSSELRTKLAAQSADGGGDFPEAPHAAFEMVSQLAWRTDAQTARVVFWVADAPHHDDKAKDMADALRAGAELDIHVYPVASSGIDTLTELSMRSAAQLTGGRYLFLTDDSGVGGAHLEPHLPCYFVTHLDSAIERMVDIELSGTYREPHKSELIRSAGDPQDGACTLASGDEVQAF